MGRKRLYVAKPTSFGPADAYAGVMKKKKEKAEIYRRVFLDFVEKAVENVCGAAHLHKDWEPVTYLFEDEFEWEKKWGCAKRGEPGKGAHRDAPLQPLRECRRVSVYGFRRVTGSVASNRKLGYKSSVSLEWDRL